MLHKIPQENEEFIGDGIHILAEPIHPSGKNLYIASNIDPFDENNTVTYDAVLLTITFKDKNGDEFTIKIADQFQNQKQISDSIFYKGFYLKKSTEIPDLDNGKPPCIILFYVMNQNTYVAASWVLSDSSYIYYEKDDDILQGSSTLTLGDTKRFLARSNTQRFIVPEQFTVGQTTNLQVQDSAKWSSIWVKTQNRNSYIHVNPSNYSLTIFEQLTEPQQTEPHYYSKIVPDGSKSIDGPPEDVTNYADYDDMVQIIEELNNDVFVYCYKDKITYVNNTYKRVLNYDINTDVDIPFEQPKNTTYFQYFKSLFYTTYRFDSLLNILEKFHDKNYYLNDYNHTNFVEKRGRIKIKPQKILKEKTDMQEQMKSTLSRSAIMSIILKFKENANFELVRTTVIGQGMYKVYNYQNVFEGLPPAVKLALGKNIDEGDISQLNNKFKYAMINAIAYYKSYPRFVWDMNFEKPNPSSIPIELPLSVWKDRLTSLALIIIPIGLSYALYTGLGPAYISYANHPGRSIATIGQFTESFYENGLTQHFALEIVKSVIAIIALPFQNYLVRHLVDLLSYVSSPLQDAINSILEKYFENQNKRQRVGEIEDQGTGADQTPPIAQDPGRNDDAVNNDHLGDDFPDMHEDDVNLTDKDKLMLEFLSDTKTTKKKTIKEMLEFARRENLFDVSFENYQKELGKLDFFPRGGVRRDRIAEYIVQKLNEKYAL